MNKSLILILPFVIICLISASAQQLISTTGGNSEHAIGKISWSIGEIATSTHSNNNYSITEGLHQPDLIVTSIRETSENIFEVTAHPNPVSNTLILNIQTENTTNFSYKLIDVSGKLLVKRKVLSGQNLISMSSFESSMYFLIIYKGKNELKTFQIIKN